MKNGLSDNAQLAPYENLYVMARDKIGLRARVVVALQQDPTRIWHVQMDRDKDAATISCPPHELKHEPTFLHYLCSIKIAEGGWPVIQAALSFNDGVAQKLKHFTKDEISSLAEVWISRTTDSFLDFFAFRMVAEKLGLHYFRTFARAVTALSIDDLLQHFSMNYQHIPIPFTTYLFCLDWFAMLYVLSENIDKETHNKLAEKYDALIRDPRFLETTYPDLHERMERIREFYRNATGAFRGYPDLLKDKIACQRVFKEYWQRIWDKTEFDVQYTIL